MGEEGDKRRSWGRAVEVMNENKIILQHFSTYGEGLQEVLLPAGKILLINGARVKEPFFSEGRGTGKSP